jgi:hypothetical protein
MRKTLAHVVVGLAILLGASSWLIAQSGASALQGAWTVQEGTNPKPVPDLPKKPLGLVLFVRKTLRNSGSGRGPSRLRSRRCGQGNGRPVARHLGTCANGGRNVRGQ